jgi:hypothetical protein
VTSDVVYTFTVGTSLIRVTEPGFVVQTLTESPASPASASSGSSSGGKKVNVAAIVAGVLGAVLLL